MKDSTPKTKRSLLSLYLILAILTLAIFGMLGAFSTMEAGAAPRRTPVPTCRPGVEGRDFCADRFQTSVARPNQRNVPIQATPTRRAK